MKVFYFSFLVQRFKSVKKILKPAGASRKFEALLERQENLKPCWSVKKILKPAGASRKFEALLEHQENFEAKNVSQDFCAVEN